LYFKPAADASPRLISGKLGLESVKAAGSVAAFPFLGVMKRESTTVGTYSELENGVALTARLLLL
jgi:hypothetical protein